MPAALIWVPVPGSGLLQPAASGVPLFWEPGRPPLAPPNMKVSPERWVGKTY